MGFSVQYHNTTMLTKHVLIPKTYQDGPAGAGVAGVPGYIVEIIMIRDFSSGSLDGEGGDRCVVDFSVSWPNRL